MRTAGYLRPFFLVSMLWGASFYFIKIAIDGGVPPAWVAFWRCCLGALTLWIILAARRESVPRDRRLWWHSAVVAFILNSVPFTLFALGETMVSSVVAGMWNATSPLFTVLFAILLLPEERPGPRRLAGLACGFAGALVVLEAWRGLQGDLVLGSLACLGATACYGVGFVYTKRFLSGRGESVTALTAAQLSAATVQLLLVAPFTGAPVWPGYGGAAALLVLGAGGTGIAFLLNFTVIRRAGSTVASTVTYVTPLWSTALGAVLLGEHVGLPLVLGGLLVIAGVSLARHRRRPAPAPAPSPEPTGRPA
ncbi:MAG TPA: DMT family transporter [Nonomuraea sp.]|nr:DMT family transporter [Nonomuraea sp.]